MPTIYELLDVLGHASWFLKLDLCQVFHQIRMAEDDIPRQHFAPTRVITNRVMPFGLSNAPLMFQVTMNELLKPFLWKFVAVLFDDILVYNNFFESHLLHLESVFHTLL